MELQPGQEQGVRGRSVTVQNLSDTRAGRVEISGDGEPEHIGAGQSIQKQIPGQAVVANVGQTNLGVSTER